MVSVSMRCGSVITHLSIKTPDIRVRYHLSDDRPDAQNAKLRRTVLVEVEVLAYTNREIGPMLGGRHREELADFERRLADPPRVQW